MSLWCILLFLRSPFSSFSLHPSHPQEPSRRDHSGTDPNDPTQPKKRSRTGKGKEKYDSRRANSSEKPKPKPEAYKKFSDEDLKKPEQREIVMDESERALFAVCQEIYPFLKYVHKRHVHVIYFFWGG